jgi:hypothetical protein
MFDATYAFLSRLLIMAYAKNAYVADVYLIPHAYAGARERVRGRERKTSATSAVEQEDLKCQGLTLADVRRHTCVTSARHLRGGEWTSWET